ncbi:hypothetical protein MAPG_10776 [Magnaporthiopsis poae ATCC 64411]|uniref:Uncharacterized protein n=1 Tax=Magnaporthiopsis poae (strain ATCC 64411 / 73-15) TaxID=644358 RepID=A0A0C4EDH6_MAGP6|nr:hypothetical protein MAPG_10776 [Magnaporthiopsis poae ATCC 64411]
MSQVHLPSRKHGQEGYKYAAHSARASSSFRLLPQESSGLPYPLFSSSTYPRASQTSKFSIAARIPVHLIIIIISSSSPLHPVPCSPVFEGSSSDAQEKSPSTSWPPRFAPARAAAPTWSTTRTAGSASTARTGSALKQASSRSGISSCERGPSSSTTRV